MEAHADSANGEATISPATTRAVQRAILAFYDARRRALPWRETADPYRVWVSEMMLQQTRVATVIPYYERWLARFPDLERLADADPDDVLAAWQGLGYYSRARHLHRAAQLVRERHAGHLPQTAAALGALPGIGRYTAGAIASIAFGERTAAVDGNVRRVLARLLDAELVPADLERCAQQLVPAERPGDFNQGMMELGATICTPRAPRCDECPVRAHCRAAHAGTQALRPAAKIRAAVPEFTFVTLVVRSPAGVLLTRSHGGLLAGLWRFPSAPRAGDVSSAARAALRRLTGSRSRPTLHGRVSHTFSHRREHYDVASLNVRSTATPRTDGEWRWANAAQLLQLALPAAQRRILRLVESQRASS